MSNANQVIENAKTLIAENRRLRAELNTRYDNLASLGGLPKVFPPNAHDFDWSEYRATMEPLDRLFAEARNTKGVQHDNNNSSNH